LYLSFGSLLHPLSPRGKLVHRGLEGLGATGRLVEAALAASGDDGSIVLRDELYRLAVAEQHATDLQNVAANHADDWAEWIDRAELPQHRIRGTTLLGALRMHGPCKVLHVPSYLRGLWKACEVLAETKGCGVKWFTLEDDVAEAWKDRLEKYDAVVLAAGAGLFQSGLLSPGDFPVQLVRGQSLELRRRSDAEQPAILCGKYLSPVPNNSSLTLVGATHEFAATPLTKDEVISEMKRRTADFAPDLWADDVEVERLTVGTRVQSERSSLGRLPLIGRLPNCDIHSNAWLFTGLSSRGLLYHGLYGDMLTDEIRAGNEDAELSRDSCLTWWKKK
jgi:glycine/D-amino acid oxidase-like deaminating enzyme